MLLVVVGLFCRYGVVGVGLVACYCGDYFEVFVGDLVGLVYCLV